MMKSLIVSSLILMIPALVSAKTQTKSTYTDIKADCITVSSATEQAPIDFFESECKAFGGYKLKISGGDLRYGPELSFSGTEINLQRPGAFHDTGSQKIEWVYDLTQDVEGSGKIYFKALIYRLSVANEYPEKDSSILYVVRLNGQKSCIIGTSKTNQGALKLANTANAKCVTL